MRVKILLLSISILALFTIACGPVDDSPGSKCKPKCSDNQICKEDGTCQERDKQEEPKEINPCTGESKHIRCTEESPSTFGRATYINSIKFSDDTLFKHKDNQFALVYRSIFNTKNVDINHVVEEARKNSNVVFILEIPDWKTEMPTGSVPVFLWQGTTRPVSTSSTPASIDVYKRVKEGSYSNSYFPAVEIDSNGSLKTTRKGKIRVPFVLGALEMDVEVVDAGFSGIVTAGDQGGFTLENGVWSGYILKDGLFDAMVEVAEEKCGYCTETIFDGKAKWFRKTAPCDEGDSIIHRVKKLCNGLTGAANSLSREESPFNLVFDKEGKLSVVIALEGEPVVVDHMVTLPPKL